MSALVLSSLILQVILTLCIVPSHLSGNLHQEVYFFSVVAQLCAVPLEVVLLCKVIGQRGDTITRNQRNNLFIIAVSIILGITTIVIVAFA